MPAELHTILKLRVPVIVQVGERRMPMAEVLSLVPGAIIELPKSSEQDLDLLVNNIPIAQGTAVKVAEKFGLKITAVGTTRQLVQAMAGQQPQPDAADQPAGDNAGA
jgi:flagellar motor switch protein FliN